jgi:hypothetical protein
MEMIVKVGSQPTGYQDGDVIRAFTLGQIYFTHADAICSPKNFDKDVVTGLRVNGSLLEKYLEKTHKYKFERVNSNEVVRTTLATMEQATFSPTPNENGEYINPYEYISRRLKNKNHKIFGSTGLEVWYGKSMALADVDLDDIWNDIETDTGFLKEDHSKWPFSPMEKVQFLVASCADRTIPSNKNTMLEFDDMFVEEKMYPQSIPSNEENNSITVLHKRRWKFPYWDLASRIPAQVDDIRNPSKSIDPRGALADRPYGRDMFVDKVTP